MTERIKTGESGRQYTVRTNRHGIDYVLGRLREKRTVKTLALLFTSAAQAALTTTTPPRSHVSDVGWSHVNDAS
jgi:hypothetical protein